LDLLTSWSNIKNLPLPLKFPPLFGMLSITGNKTTEKSMEEMLKTNTDSQFSAPILIKLLLTKLIPKELSKWIPINSLI